MAESVKHALILAVDGLLRMAIQSTGEHFDLVICDLNMCHVDGLTMVTMLREFEQGTGKHLPVVLMTAFQAADGKDELEQSGVDKVLIKPVRPADIDQILNDMFEEKR